MKTFARTLLATAFIALARMASAAPAVSAPPSLLLISIDGFRWDQVDAGRTPNLDKLARTGVRAEMIPVWPSITHPNHWALVTGLYPNHGGVLANDMYDVASGKLYPRTRTDSMWFRGEPIWTAVTKQGGTAGVLVAWIGARVADGPNRPTFFVPYSNEEQGHDNRAALALDVLDQDPATRPKFLALYFGEVDDRQHEHGFGSPEAMQAIATVDRQIGVLAAGLEQRGLKDKVNVIVVSDHGMMNVGDGQVVLIDDLIDLNQLEIPPVGSGVNMYLWPKEVQAAALYEKLRKAHPHLRVYRPEDLPTRFHWSGSDRIPPLVVTADPGWITCTKANETCRKYKGQHGYDTTLRDMHALFIAAGPGINSGVKLDPFENVNVYSLMAELLHVPPAPNDGSIKPLCEALRERPASCGK